MDKVKVDYNFSPEDVAFVYNLLRKGTTVWSGRKEVLRRARQKVLVKRSKTGKPVFKYQWQCAVCQQWSRDEASMEVDHIVEIGGVSSFNGDWNEMIFKIMPRPVEKYLQAICIPCHMKKTKAYTSANKLWKRKR